MQGAKSVRQVLVNFTPRLDRVPILKKNSGFLKSIFRSISVFYVEPKLARLTAPENAMHLLLVEDDPELANRLIYSLAQWNYTIDAAQTGSAAVAACSTTHYQLVILDLELPDITGVEVIRQLRWQGLSSPILMLTARDELQDRVVEDMDGNDCVLKPFSIGELVARIRALLKRASSEQLQLCAAESSILTQLHGKWRFRAIRLR